MNNAKELPIADSPITSLHYLAFPLYIMLNHEECYGWFYSNYIQLQWNKRMVPHFTYYMEEFNGNNPWLSLFLMKKSILAHNRVDLDEFLVTAINDGYYIYSWFDEFYIPERNAYNTRHFIHDFLVTGYDLGKREYSVLGYSKNRVMESCKVSFDDFRKAYESPEQPGMNKGWWEDEVKLICKTDDHKYWFDLKNVHDLLEDYLLSKDSSERNRLYRNPNSENVYGIEVYNYLRKYMNLLAEKKANLDLRPLYTLYEHKKCMYQRMQYIFNNNYIKEMPDVLPALKAIEQSASVLYKLQLKYQFSSNNNILAEIINKLSEIEAAEKQVLERILEEIRRTIDLKAIV